MVRRQRLLREMSCLHVAAAGSSQGAREGSTPSVVVEEDGEVVV